MTLGGLFQIVRSGLLVGLVLGTSAFAQRRSTENAEAAKVAFVAGERAFKDDDYALALEHFRRAMQLAPRDAVRFNLAVCLERLGRFREAYREYDIATRSTELDEGALSRAREQAARTKDRLGTVRFEKGPSISAEASVTLGDEHLGSIPVTVLVDPAAHDFEVRTAEQSLHLPVTVGRGETRVIRLGQGRALPVEAPRLIGPLTWVGVGLAVAGAGSFIGFGLNATALHNQYLALPTQDTLNRGVFSRDVANVSLAVAITGALLVGIDLLIHALSTPAPPMLELIDATR